MPRALLAAACAAVLVVAAQAAAQSNSDPDARWGAHAGAVGGRDTASASFSAGLHWRPRITGAIGIELSAGYDRLTWEAGGARVEADHVPVEGSLLFFFLFTRRVQPYLVAGLAYHWVNPHGTSMPDGSPYPSQNLFGLHAGAGVDARVGERVSVWLDGRWTFLDVDAVSALGLKSDVIRVAAGVNLAF